MTEQRKIVIIDDVYRLALHRAADIEKQIVAQGLRITPQEQLRHDLIQRNAFPHQSLDFSDDVAYSYELPQKAR